jgi:DNA polymerase-3 subunit epsilon
MKFEKLVFVDLETTGANATVDRITEIGLVEVDANGKVTHWSTLVNPSISIPPFIQGLTGISNEMVREAPSFNSLAKDLYERLQGALFIAHNVRFDYGFLRNEFTEAGYTFKAEVLCTVKLSRKLYPDHSRHNLDALVARHNLKVSARHRALGDADLLWQLWQKIHTEFESDTIHEALRTLTKTLFTIARAIGCTR